MTGAPTDTESFFTLNDNEVFRLLAADIFCEALPVAQSAVFLLKVIDKMGTGTSVTVAKGIRMSGSAVNPLEAVQFEHICPIVGPGCELVIEMENNTATNTYSCGIYGVTAPVGTVFYV